MSTVARLSIQDYYGPKAGRTPTVSRQATAGAVKRPQGAAMESNAAALDKAFSVFSQSNVVYGFLVLAVMLIGLRLLSDRVGTVEEFKGTVRVTVFNVLVISLAAIIGINFWKLLFTRFPIRHITPVVLAT